jgi:pimeloyl-ACP methyl ester carboxylesterase
MREEIGRSGAMAERPVLYLLPGLLCDADIWADQRAALEGEAEIRVPEFRGLRSIGAMAERVLEDAPERFALAGHSMGGRVALEVHALAASRIERLMLMDTGFGPPSPAEAPGRLRLVELAHNEGMAALAAAWLPPMVAPARESDHTLIDRLTAMVCRATPAQFEGQIQALLNRSDATPELSRIACPTTIVCGREDRWSPLARHETMHQKVAGSRLVVIEDAGHMVTVEQPEAVNQALKDWLFP